MTTDSRTVDDADLELIEAARRVAETHSDGVIHTVGAAVRDSEDRIHTGINLFHFTGGPCAELVALATARANGARTLKSIVAVGDRGRWAILPRFGVSDDRNTVVFSRQSSPGVFRGRLEALT